MDKLGKSEPEEDMLGAEPAELTAEELLRRIDQAEERLRRSIATRHAAPARAEEPTHGHQLNRTAPATATVRERAAALDQATVLEQALIEQAGSSAFRKLLLIMSIEIGDGRSASIDICEGDTAGPLADAFTRAHGLTEVARATLLLHVDAQLQQLAAERQLDKRAVAAQQAQLTEAAVGALEEQEQEQGEVFELEEGSVEEEGYAESEHADSGYREYKQQAQQWTPQPPPGLGEYGRAFESFSSNEGLHPLHAASPRSPGRGLGSHFGPSPAPKSGPPREQAVGGVAGYADDIDGDGSSLLISRQQRATSAGAAAGGTPGAARAKSADQRFGYGAAGGASPARSPGRREGGREAPHTWLESNSSLASAFGAGRRSPRAVPGQQAAEPALVSPRRRLSPRAQASVSERLLSDVERRRARIEGVRVRVQREQAQRLELARVSPPRRSAGYVAARRAAEAEADARLVDEGSSRAGSVSARSAGERLHGMAAQSQHRLATKRQVC
ncbi:hypothetical protein T492DRAFT_840062 [Pavlovales sp. CCMP2436]|nr:hypothetical protein T492DRAFT_840062 [Pavlovales sp. CCMP2436]